MLAGEGFGLEDEPESLAVFEGLDVEVPGELDESDEPDEELPDESDEPDEELDEASEVEDEEEVEEAAEDDLPRLSVL